MKKKKRTCQYLRRTVSVLVLAAVLFSNVGVCFASDMHFARDKDVNIYSAVPKKCIGKKVHYGDSDKKALYERVNSVLIKFTIKNGSGQGVVLLHAKSAHKMDAARISMTFMNKKNGKIKTFTGKMIKRGNRYSYNQNYRLPQKGTYYVKVKIRCYNDGRIVEMLNKTSADSRYEKK